MKKKRRKRPQMRMETGFSTVLSDVGTMESALRKLHLIDGGECCTVPALRTIFSKIHVDITITFVTTTTTTTEEHYITRMYSCYNK